MFIKIMTVQVLARGMGVKTAAWPDSEIADQLSYCRTACVEGGGWGGDIGNILHITNVLRV